MSQMGKFGAGGGSGTLSTLTGNTGGPVPPSAGDINVVGTGPITVTGNPGSSTLTISSTGGLAASFATDSGTAIPSSGIINILGGTNIGSVGAGNTVTINLDDNITVTSMATADAVNGITVSSNSITADGSATDIDINLVPKGVGSTVLNSAKLADSLDCNGQDIAQFANLTGIFPQSTLQTYTTATSTMLLRAYNTGGASYTTFATLTAGASPTMDLSDSVTKASNYIYRAGGTDVAVADGGTGVSTVPSNGQLLIGNGTGYTVANLTAGSGILITNGAGSISIATTGGTVWSVVTTGQTGANAVGYFTNAGGNVNVALPAVSSVGDTFQVAAMSAGGWTITQGVGQQIQIGNSTTTSGVGGSLASTAIGDWITLVCSVANANWICKVEMGNITVV